MLSGSKPDARHLRTFGCLVEELVPESQRSKLDSKSTKLIHMGHVTATVSRGYNARTGRVHTVRHVMFDETTLPGTGHSAQSLETVYSETSTEELNTEHVEEVRVHISDSEEKLTPDVESEDLQ